jgi:hypothetical protein
LEAGLVGSDGGLGGRQERLVGKERGLGGWEAVWGLRQGERVGGMGEVGRQERIVGTPLSYSS